MSDLDKLLAAGAVSTVEQILGDAPQAPAVTFNLARLDSSPLSIQPGLYFDLPEEEYHAQPALSCSGIKKMASSPMLFWATCPWLNDEIEQSDDKEWAVAGKAYHARILEGRAVFADRFAVALNKADFEGLIATVDEAQAAIRKAGHEPVSRVPTGEEKPDKKTGEMLPVLRAAKKEDFIAQLLDIVPEAPIWENLCARHVEANDGKTMIPFDLMRRIEIAARMIEQHEEMNAATTGGHPEVSLFWTCAKTGVPMKARVDYLKLKMMVDLKSYANQQENSPERAIQKQIANQRYFLQPNVYWEGAAAVKALVRAHGASVVHGTEDQTAFAFKWADRQEPPAWLWIFQQKGIAPVTRGVLYPRGSLNLVAGEIVASMKRRFRKASDTFGTDPWLDIVPVYDLADDEIPSWSTEI